MKNFLLADDHNIVRSAIKGILLEVFKPCRVNEAGNGEEILEQLKMHRFDLVIMDVQMPMTDSLGILEFITIRHPGVRVLIFSISPEKIFAKRFLKAGAKGFVSKESSLQEVTKAINAVLAGGTYISETLSGSLVEDMSHGHQPRPFETLSSREFEIVSLLLEGQTISQVARSINLQASTVGTHKARIFRKLNICNLLELKEIARSHKM